MQTDGYSRMVALLKVILPLLALGILSTLFLISRVVDRPSTIPFADNDVQQRLINQQVTGPYFSSTSANGDEITFIAETVTTPNGRMGANRALDVDVQVDMVGGRRITVTGEQADVDIASDRTDLTGDVEVITSDGFVLRSDLLEMRMSRIEMISPDEVTATTPMGHLQAGAMRLLSPDKSPGSQLHFTGGVKLLYQPKSLKE